MQPSTMLAYHRDSNNSRIVNTPLDSENENHNFKNVHNSSYIAPIFGIVRNSALGEAVRRLEVNKVDHD